MSDVRELLERGVAGAEPPPDPFERMLRRHDRRRRNQRIRAGVLGLTIAVAAVLVGANLIRSGPRETGVIPTPTPSRTQSPTPSATPTQTQSPTPPPQPLVNLGVGIYFVDVQTGEATRVPQSYPFRRDKGYFPGQFDVSPDGTRILWSENGESPAGTTQIYVANRDGTGVRQLTHDPEGAFRASWSPDGTRIVYVGRWRIGEGDMNEDVELFVLDLGTGGTISVISGRAGGLQEPSFSPDARSILFTRDGSQLGSVPVTGGTSTVLLEDVAYAMFSPDGSMLIYPRHVEIRIGRGFLGGKETWLADADGSNARKLTPIEQGNPWGGEAGHWSPDGTRVAFDDEFAFVVDVASGDATAIADGHVYGWLDDDTLIVHGL